MWSFCQELHCSTDWQRTEYWADCQILQHFDLYLGTAANQLVFLFLNRLQVTVDKAFQLQDDGPYVFANHLHIRRFDRRSFDHQADSGTRLKT